MLEVKVLTDQHLKDWDRYVARHPDGTIYHTTAWRDLVRDVQKHSPVYLAAWDGGKLKGILPLFNVNTFLSGLKMISVPHGVVGGVCADSDDAAFQLVDYAKKIVKERNGEYLELRQTRRLKGDMPVIDQYTTVKTKLIEPDILFKKLRPDIRRCLRRSLESELEILLESDDVDTFYRIYSEGLRNFGTPVEGKVWITEIIRRFPENHCISYVTYKGDIVLAKLMRRYKNEITPVISYGLREFQNTYSEHRLCWAWMEKGYQDEYKYFNFGRSLYGSGAFKFKIGWCGEETPLYYHYYLVNRQTLPDYSQTAGGRKVFASIWKRLPLWITNRLGPKIRRSYP